MVRFTALLLCLALASLFAASCGSNQSTEAVCDDSVDNDEDGLTDCDDSDCASSDACDLLGDDDDSQGDDDDSQGDDDDSAGDDDDSAGDDDDSAGDDDDSAEEPVAVLSGVVTRSAAVSGDGVGTLIVDVLSGDPFGKDESFTIASFVLEDVDFNPAGVAIAYEMEVPIRAEPYVIGAAFDDNGDADLENFFPGEGDLLSLDPTSSVPLVTLSEEIAYEVDLDLGLTCCPF